MSAMDWSAKPFREWTDDDLLTCVRWWAEELGLCSWRVTSAFEQRHQVDALGRCRYNQVYENAHVMIAEWRSRDAADPLENNIEADVVHELLHVRLDAFMGETAESERLRANMQELAIERIAHALVRQRRRAAA